MFFLFTLKIKFEWSSVWDNICLGGSIGHLAKCLDPLVLSTCSGEGKGEGHWPRYEFLTNLYVGHILWVLLVQHCYNVWHINEVTSHINKIRITVNKLKQTGSIDSSSSFIFCHSNYHKTEKMWKISFRNIYKCDCLSQCASSSSLCDSKCDNNSKHHFEGRLHLLGSFSRKTLGPVTHTHTHTRG